MEELLEQTQGTGVMSIHMGDVTATTILHLKI